jgi:hypothetical protein
MQHGFFPSTYIPLAAVTILMPQSSYYQAIHFHLTATTMEEFLPDLCWFG